MEYTDVPIEPKCNCDQMPVRMRTLINGVKAYYPQCVKCGRTGQAVKKDTFTPRELDHLEPFDNTLQDSWQQTVSTYYQRKREVLQDRVERERAEKSAEWWAWYTEYLNSSKWAEKRERVLKRAGYTCEGCGVNNADHAHHLTYEHAGNEFLFELRAVCAPCHRELHPGNGMGTWGGK